MRELFEIQKNHAARLTDIINERGAALDGSVTGAGKTLIAAEIASTNQPPTFVVCPKSAIPMWQAELKDRGVKNVLGIINYEMLRGGRTQWGTFGDGSGLKLVWQWKLPADSFIIWDECQRGQGMNTQNAHMMWSAKPYYNLCLSATAVENPAEMKALGYLLSLHDLKGFWNWTKMHGCTPGTYGGLDFTGDPEDIDRLHKIVYPRHGSRLSFRDMAPFFKATEIITTPLDFGDDIKRVYTEMAVELAILESRASSDWGNDALTIRLRARQKVELLKVPEMVDRVPDLLKEGFSLVIFVNFTATAEALRSKIKVPCGMFTGKHEKTRQRDVEEFQADRLRVMIVNVQAGSTNLSLNDTHGNHPRIAFISPSDNAKDVIQCCGRVHRAGGLTTTRQYVLFAAGTVEEEVEANCREKMTRIDIFNEGMS